MAAKKKAEIPIVVTTAHRGVFVGYADGLPTGDTVTLRRARMIVYYSADAHGVVGIGAHGPGKNARVSPAVAELVLRNVTGAWSSSAKATAAWEAEPWN